MWKGRGLHLCCCKTCSIGPASGRSRLQLVSRERRNTVTHLVRKSSSFAQTARSALPLKGAILTETKPWGLGQAISGILLTKKLLGLNDKEVVGEEIKKPGLILRHCLRRLLESRNTNKGFPCKTPTALCGSFRKKKIKEF